MFESAIVCGGARAFIAGQRNVKHKDRRNGGARLEEIQGMPRTRRDLFGRSRERGALSGRKRTHIANPIWGPVVLQQAGFPPRMLPDGRTKVKPEK
jgi:hypothetical protein